MPFVLFENTFVVGIDDFPQVFHAAVANFDIVAVEDLVERIMLRDIYVYGLDEFFPVLVVMCLL